MAREDDLFIQEMRALGVQPLQRKSPPRPLPQPAPEARLPAAASDAAEQSLFLRAVTAEPTADKDRASGLGAGTSVRKLKAPKRLTLNPEDVLDLHGETLASARLKLATFVRSAAARKLKTVMVITGVGHHSAGGVSVLAKMVEEWVRNQGKPWIRAFSPAPPARGGRGAFLLHLLPPP